MRAVNVDRLLLGPPGTGKTTSLLGMVDTFLQEGTPPERIAFLSFTRKAAEEARDRACAKFNMDKDQFVYFRTLHSLAYRILGVTSEELFSREHARKLGSALGLNLSYIPTGYAEGTAVPLGGDEGSVLMSVHSLAQVTMVPLFQAWQTYAEGRVTFNKLQHFSESYTKYKQDNGLLDFNDMLEKLTTIQGEGYFPHLDVCILDEAQDLTRLQWRAFSKISENSTVVIAAGDDDQSIYEWSGADVETFLSLQATERKVLDKSYRLNRGVFTKAASILDKIGKRYEKEWSPITEDCDTVSNVVSIEELDLLDTEQRWLLLVRNKCFMEELIAHCHKLSVPYRVAGGSGPLDGTALTAIRDWEKLRKGEKVSREAALRIYSFMRLGDQVTRGHKFLPGVGEDDMVSLNTLVAKHGLKTRAPWFESLVRIGSADIEYFRLLLKRKEKLQARITISTIHGAKGGEEDNVAVFLDQAYMTYRAAQENPDAEHRVFYVGVTRAKKKLFVVSPRSKYGYKLK